MTTVWRYGNRPAYYPPVRANALFERVCLVKGSIRRGFTLVEMLVVIAIIGTLVALLLPAVQMTRESARATTCRNQLRQVALALQNYHSAREALPAGVCNRNAAANVPASLGDLRTPDTWFAETLSFLEQQSLQDQFKFSEGSGSPANKPLVATPLAGVACPSDSDGAGAVCDFRCNLFASQTAAKMVGLWYAASLGNNPLWNQCTFCTPAFPAATNLACCASKDRGVDGHPSGMFAVAKVPMTFAKTTDGLSKTILLGETLPRENMHNGAFTGHYPVIATNIPVNSFVPRDEWPRAGAHATNYGEAGGIKSRHPGGAHAAFADGSVSLLAESIRFEVLLALGSGRAGETVNRP
jgi:prepilin-type N-terminal cleavage/methylation domain-containing protein/prepilin-type processing-associated H-X9-DG protein